MLFIKSIEAMLILISLLVLILYILKKVNFNYPLSRLKINSNQKLKIEEQVFLSPKTRMIVVDYDDYKYVLLIGSNEMLIDKIRKP